MGDTGPFQPRAAFKAMIEDLNAILDATADFDPDDGDDDESLSNTRELYLQVTEALCVLERDFPLSELSIFVHEILHVDRVPLEFRTQLLVLHYGTIRRLDEGVCEEPLPECGKYGTCSCAILVLPCACSIIVVHPPAYFYVTTLPFKDTYCTRKIFLHTCFLFCLLLQS